jgi:hypothetical protein
MAPTPPAAPRRYSPILAFLAGVMLTLAVEQVVRGASQRPAAANSTDVPPARAGRARAGGALATTVAASAQARGARPVSKGEAERALRIVRYDAEAARVGAHNAHRSRSWTEEVNEYAMMSAQERAKRTLGHTLLHFPKTARMLPPLLTVRAPPAGGAVGARRTALPAALDWRDAGVVTPVKNQGYCGSCWAFAATQAIESRWAMAYGKERLPELAVQQIVSCADVLGAAPWSWWAPVNGSGCFGGFETAAYDYVKNFGYLAQASAFPYLSGMPWRFPQGMMGSAQNGQCVGPFEPYGGPSARDVDISGPAAVLSAWELTSLTYGATVSGYATVERSSEAATMAALASEGPLAIVVDASAWHSYKAGVFNGCNQSDLQLNHAVQVRSRRARARERCEASQPYRRPRVSDPFATLPLLPSAARRLRPRRKAQARLLARAQQLGPGLGRGGLHPAAARRGRREHAVPGPAPVDLGGGRRRVRGRERHVRLAHAAVLPDRRAPRDAALGPQERVSEALMMRIYGRLHS